MPHSAFDLKIEDSQTLLISRGFARATVEAAWRNLQVVIIDEASMLRDRILSQIDNRLNSVLGCSSSSTHFGDRAVVLVGDFAQLPPVCGKFVFEPSTEISVGRFHLFRSLFYPMFLTIPQRQRSDIEFASLLDRVRQGHTTDEDLEQLLSRCVNSEKNPHSTSVAAELNSPAWQTALYLFPTKKQVELHNVMRLQAFARSNNLPIYEIHAVDRRTNRRSAFREM